MAVHAFEPLADVVCWPWHLHFLGDEAGHPRGGCCRFCARDIAIPANQTRGRFICRYCALDHGLIEAVDAPFQDQGA